MSALNKNKICVAITGASGFVGEALEQRLSQNEKYDVVCLSRHKRDKENWRQADFYYYPSALRALQGVDVAIFLIHSMIPNHMISLGHFADFDLLAAHNFAEACHKNGVKQIIYLGGMIPELPDSKLSWHLRSRLEVEQVINSLGLDQVILRAPIILGERGSSFQISYRLALHAPAVFTHSWMKSVSSPVPLKRVISLLEQAILNDKWCGEIIDIRGDEELSYEDFLRRIGKFLERKLFFLKVPFLWIWATSLSIALLTKAPYELVKPLVGSLRFSLKTRNGQNLLEHDESVKSLDDSIRELVEHLKNKSAAPYNFTLSKGRHHVKSLIGVQRLPLPAHKDLEFVAHEYFRWVGRSWWIPILVTEDDSGFQFRLPLLKTVLLSFRQADLEGAYSCVRFHIVGGILKSRNSGGYLEFRGVLSSLALNAIYGFVPSLPAFLYKVTQAPFHHLVMRCFYHHLKRLCRNAQGGL